MDEDKDDAAVVGEGTPEAPVEGGDGAEVTPETPAEGEEEKGDEEETAAPAETPAAE